MTRPLIALYGLDTMGRPIAQRLQEQGWLVLGLDSSARTEFFTAQALQGACAPTIADATAVLICVTDEAAARW
jgi:3-hydroxyisobutyrate dehydrogenase-like beta-hydroxyacid dehydrogenase